jgi:gluconolactonase
MVVMNQKHLALYLILGIAALACQPAKEIKTAGTIERLDPELDNIISADAKVEIIAQGYTWSEGPLWIEDQKMLLFSDVPENKVYKWTEEKGATLYLEPSGFTGDSTTSRERGANGLTLNDEGSLVLAQHGDRRIAIMDAALDSPKAVYTSLAATYQGKKFNSPNDVVMRNYNFYFTDPPYGLGKGVDDPIKEIPFQGVYCAFADGKIDVLIDSITRPNGIAFSPDGKLFIANSDPEKARWYQYELDDSSKVVSGKIFYDATALTAKEKGLPDGMKIDSKGNVYASGPGGVWIFNASGKVLGKIKLTEAASNTALSSDEKTLYVTNDMYVIRVKMRD